MGGNMAGGAVGPMPCRGVALSFLYFHHGFASNPDITFRSPSPGSSTYPSFHKNPSAPSPNITTRVAAALQIQAWQNIKSRRHSVNIEC